MLSTRANLSARKAATVGVLLAAMFAQTLQQVTNFSALGYLDDVALLLLAGWTLVATLIRGELRLGFPGVRLYGLFLCSGILSAFLHAVPMDVWLRDAYLLSKAGMFAICVMNIPWTTNDVRVGARLGRRLALVLLFAGILQLAVPVQWTAVFSSTGVPDFRFGRVASLVGLFKHPSFYAQSLTIVAVFSGVAAIQLRSGRSRNTIAAVWSVVFALLTFRRKTLFALVLASYRVARLYIRRFPAVISILFLIFAGAAVVEGSAAVSLIKNTYEGNFDNPNRTPRAVLLDGMVQIAKGDFPLGAGFGRFGTPTAVGVGHYSPEYESRAFYLVYGLGTDPNDQQFAADDFWPAVVGQGGVIGLVGFGGALVMVSRRMRQLVGHDLVEVRILAGCTLALNVSMLVESVASPVYYGPPTYPVVFGLAALTVVLADSPYRAQQASLVSTIG